MSEKALIKNQNEAKTKRESRRSRPLDAADELSGEKLTVIHIGRVSKTVKGGKRFSFRALVAVGDCNGSVGVSLGKGNQVQLAIKKASAHAKKEMIKFPLVNNTIPHEIIGVFGSGRVWMRPAAPGTGVIAGGGVRAVLEAGGVKNILTKSLGSTNPFNMVYATIEGLERLKTKEESARMRGKSLGAAPQPAPAVESQTQ